MSFGTAHKKRNVLSLNQKKEEEKEKEIKRKNMFAICSNQGESVLASRPYSAKSAFHANFYCCTVLFLVFFVSFFVF